MNIQSVACRLSLRNSTADQIDHPIGVVASHLVQSAASAPPFQRSDLGDMDIHVLVLGGCFLAHEKPKAGSENVDRRSRLYTGFRNCCRALGAAVVGLHRGRCSLIICVCAEPTASARARSRFRRIRPGCRILCPPGLLFSPVQTISLFVIPSYHASSRID